MRILWITLLIIYQLNAIEWCEVNELNNEKKIEIKCYQENEINKITCYQKHFYIDKKGEKKKIIFDEFVKREDVTIECEKEYDDFEFVFGKNGNDGERNGSLKTYEGEVVNCNIQDCKYYCYYCM